MKTHPVALNLIAGAALAWGSGFAIPAALAGPGPDYWRNQGKSENTAIAVPAAPTTPITRACTDARLIAVTETKTILPNGRGPMQTVEVGKKLVCTSCDTPLIVMKPSGHNARGGMAPVAIEGTHDCAKKGCTPGTSVASIE